jgi:hypothetical protein
MNAPRERTGDWIIHLDIRQQDRIILNLSGVFATREIALRHAADLLVGVDWPNILATHGYSHGAGDPDCKDFLSLDDVQMRWTVGPRTRA